MIKQYLNSKLISVSILIFMFLFINIMPWQVSAVNNDKKDVIIGVERAADLADIESYDIEIIKEFNIIDAVKARISAREVTTLSADPSIRYIEDDKPVYALFMGPPSGQDIPWGIDRVFGDKEYPFSTWDQTKGEGVPVAVLDTGIDEEHEDLPEPLGGVTTVDDTHWGQDDHGHGTHISGVIAARDNDLGVVGIAPESELYSVKVLNEAGSGTTSSIIKGIEWAVEEDIPILNMSLGTNGDSQSLEEACQEAYDAGHLLIAAAGNAGEDDNVNYPAKYDSVIAVSASNENDEIADFSDMGDEIELIAPGEAVKTTSPGDEYEYKSGTSLSTPHVSGIAALLKSKDTSLSNSQIRKLLQDTAEDIGLTSDKQGYGLSRADEAVAEIAEIESEVKELDILSGPETALIPKDGVNRYDYEAKVFDQYGDVMEEEEVVWTLNNRSDINQDNVEISSGELTLESLAEEENIKIKATSQTDNDIYDEKEVNLEYDFELISGKLKILNREESYKLTLPDDIYTIPVNGERFEEIIIENYTDYEFVEKNDNIIFDFNKLQLEDRREDEAGEIIFILKSEADEKLAKLTIKIGE